jgi:hypothetical protein
MGVDMDSWTWNNKGRKIFSLGFGLFFWLFFLSRFSLFSFSLNFHEKTERNNGSHYTTFYCGLRVCGAMVDGMVDTVGPVPFTAFHRKAIILSSFSFAPSILSSHRTRVSISATASSVVLFFSCLMNIMKYN